MASSASASVGRGGPVGPGGGGGGPVDPGGGGGGPVGPGGGGGGGAAPVGLLVPNAVTAPAVPIAAARAAIAISAADIICLPVFL